MSKNIMGKEVASSTESANAYIDLPARHCNNIALQVLKSYYIVCVRLYGLCSGSLGAARPGPHNIRNSVLSGHIVGTESTVFTGERTGKWRA